MTPRPEGAVARRGVLTMIVAAAVLGGAGSLGLLTAAQSAGPPIMYHGNGASAVPPPPAIPPDVSGEVVTGQPFADPPIIEGAGGQLQLGLTASAAPVTVSGKRVNGRVYSAEANGVTYPGAFMPPVIRLRRGQQLVVNLQNELQEATNIHTHGFFVSPTGNQDDIYELILPGGSAQHVYRNTRFLNPGTYWYHPHVHPLAEAQVFGGMSGLIEVEGLKSMLPRPLRGISEHYIGLKDFQATAGNTIPTDDIDSDAPTTRTVNGLVNPVMTMRAGETQLWHVGNIGADIWYHLQASGLRLTVLAVDANPVAKPYAARTLMMPPARRFDLLVQAPRAGTYELITRRMSTGPQGDTYPRTTLMTVKVEGAASAPVARTPATFGGQGDLADRHVARRRTFVLSENAAGTRFFINGKPFPGAVPMSATPVTGTVEEWTFINTSGEQHPIHIHVNDMQLMSVNGRRQPDDSWIDTIPVPATSKGVPGHVVVRMSFRTYTGPYVFHCHILAHEDNGMMANINVTSRPFAPAVR
ncbi:MAG: multicopper oxidase family protein [Actinobacteria bacterium]|nr:multicopper oxidase family protein [Actinomycetota bacterium]